MRPPRFLALALILPASLSASRAAETILLDEGADAVALIPSVANGGSALGDTWKGVADPANIGQWQTGTTGVGYEGSSGYENLIGLNVIGAQGNNESVFVRVPFILDAAALAEVRSLELRMKYDDGFAAWVNGVPVASANAPANPAWDDGATAGHSDTAAMVFEDFDASSGVDALQEGLNILAIQALNDGPNSSDLLALPQLVGSDVVPPVWPSLRATEIASGLSRPVDIQHAGDGSGRLFIVEKPGRVRVFKAGALVAQPFLSIESRVDDRSNEEGLLGLAFPPRFAADIEPHFYLCYTTPSSESVLSRFKVDPTDPDRALANSEEVLLRVSQPAGNHNGGQIQFGPDGYLYVGFGDGGSANDPGDRAQDGDTWLGKMLRLDVEGPPDGGKSYAVPPDNPFTADATKLDEIWALGLRNPWRFSFDRLTGDLWIADVGQNAFEEVNFQPASSTGGENYGWRYFEATRTNVTTGIVPTLPIDPVYEYGRGSGRSITGGYVYRGQRFPRMEGVYFYIDYEDNDFVGIQPATDGSTASSGVLSGFSEVTTFGEDEAGELYFATDKDSSTPNRVFLLSDVRDAEYLQITAVSRSPASGLAITVGTEIGEQYQLQTSIDLLNWMDVGGPVVASGLRTIFTPAGAGERLFVRVTTLP